MFCVCACNKSQNTSTTQKKDTTNDTKEDKDSKLSNSITATDFISNLDASVTEYDLYTLQYANSFEESGKTFKSYSITGTVDSSYLSYATLPDSEDITDILVISNAGVYTYYYATNVLLAIDENIDYKKILSELSITEDGICENNIYTTAHGDMNIVHERADDKDTLAIMFY